MVDELERKLEIEDKEIQLEIDDCLVNGVLSVDDNSDVPNLKKVNVLRATVSQYFTLFVPGIPRVFQGQRYWCSDSLFDVSGNMEKG